MKQPTLWIHAVLLAVALLLGSPHDAAAAPDLTTVDLATINRTFTYNLGPTGLRGWISNNEGRGQDGTITATSRQILVTCVGLNTPAASQLAVNDVILGASAGSGAVPMFTSDARKSFGWAIGEAEKFSNNGVLGIKRWRAGVTTDVWITLAVMASYTDTAPYHCPKSALILANARDHLVGQLRADPAFLQNTTVGGPVNGLALLAGVAPGDPHDAEVQSRLQAFARLLAPETLHLTGCDTWGWGYAGVFLSEYYLNSVANGNPDNSVLHGINEYTVALAKAQSLFGTFGHGGAVLKADGSLHGSIPWYGPVNSAGIPANLAIVMGKKALLAAGLALDPEIDPAIGRGSDFFAYYVNKGPIPYGEHEPYMDGHASNGKDAMCAVLFGVQDDRDVEAEYFARMTTAGYNGREYGHTGQGFSYLWGAMGANMGGQAAAAAYLQQVRWHLDLARRTDGSFIYDGGEQYGAGYTADGTYLGASGVYANMNSTAIYMLSYALPLQRLYITGKNANPAHILDASKVANAIAAGSYLQDCTAYTTTRLMADLNEYDPVVRAYAAAELAARALTPTDVSNLIVMAEGPDTNARMGACETLGILKAPGALPALGRRLSDPDIWVRAKAARALANFGAAANNQLTPMLTAMAANGKPAEPIDWSDPLQFPNGYLSQALFSGALADAAANAAKSLLYPALRMGLQLPSGMMRWSVAGPGNCFITDKLALTDVAALFPELRDTVITRAPADAMYGDLARQGAVLTLAKWHVIEGMDLALAYNVEPQSVLESFGEAARWVLPYYGNSNIAAATTSPPLIYGLPYAVPQVVATTTAKAITLSGSDCRNDPLSYTILTEPAHGTLTGTPPAVTYTPVASYRGVDSFTFKASTLLADSEPGTVSLIVGDAGTGLKGEYFDRMDLTALTARRTDPAVQFDWGTAAPVNTMGPDTYSVRWTGQLLAPATGTYRFSTRTGDGTRLWLNGNLLINDWNDHATRWNSVPDPYDTINLIAGQKYNLRMEYYRNASPATAGLYWATPSCKYDRIIPTQWLYPATGVSLTAPSNGSKFAARAPVTLTADATDMVGAIVNVSFYQGETLLGSASTPPYSLVWADVPAGTHHLTARATDALGAVSTSAVSTITVSGDVVPVSAGLVCWFDASVGITTDALGRITQWNDQSGQLHHAYRSTLDTQAVVAANQLNGKPALQLRGGDWRPWFALAGTFFVKQQYVVVRSPDAAWSSGGPVLNHGMSLDSNNRFVGGTTWFHYDQYPQRVSRNGTVLGVPFDLAPITDYMIVRIDVNDVNTTADKAYGIGGSGLDMDVVEILGYSTALSAADEIRVGNYLSTKYGIATAYPAVPGQAGTLNWDANGPGPGQADGSGTWINNSNTWWNGTANVNWNSGNDALIGTGGTGGALTLGEVVANNLTFGNFSGTYTLTGGSLTVDSNIIAASSGDITLNTPLIGQAGLTKSGTGTLTLNATNSYSGATVINGGTVKIRSVSALPSPARRWTAAGLTGSNGSTVSTWTDSVAGRNATTLGTAPTLVTSDAALNGRPAVHFNGSQALKVLAADSSINTIGGGSVNAFTIAVVFKPTANGSASGSDWWNNSGIVSSEQPGNTNDWGLGYSTHVVNAGQGLGSGGADTSLKCSNTSALNVGHVAIYSWDQATGQILLNVDGVQTSIGNAITARGVYDFAIGRNTPNAGNYFSGNIAEIQMFTSGLTGDMINALGYDLNQTYGLTGFNLSGRALPPNAPVAINSGGTLALDYTGNLKVGSLSINGTMQPAGVYGAASFPFFITGTGFLDVGNVAPAITDTKPAAVVLSENGSPTPFALTLHASDADGDRLTWSVSTPAAHGTATASGTGPSMAIGYTPAANYHGFDSFVVRVADGNGGSDMIPVNVTIQHVNQAPLIDEARPVEVTMSENGNPTPFNLTLHASDADGDTLTWSVSTPAGHGAATASGTGASAAISYMPAINYHGMDSFAVMVDDGNGASNTITVNVTIDYVNQTPDVTLTAPVAGAVFVAPPSLTLTATAVDTDGSVVSVDFYHGSTLIGSATSPPYSCVWTSVPLGDSHLTARATDNLGLAGTSPVAVITVIAPVAMTWDANGTGAGRTDGSGSWISASGNWWNGMANVNWVDGNDAVIGSGGAGGTLTLGDVAAHSLTFGSFTGTYTLTGGTLTLYHQLAADSSGNIFINTPIDGSAGLTKTSSGTLTLAGAASYSGATIISAGTLKLSGGAPPTVQNGGFESPGYTANAFIYRSAMNSSQQAAWVWSDGVLVNGNSAWSYANPYPNGTQACSLQNTMNPSQSLYFPAGTYSLSWSHARRSGQVNPYYFQLNGVNQGGTFAAPGDSWSTAATTFTIAAAGTHTIGFLGANAAGDQSVALDNISLSGTGGVGTLPANTALTIAAGATFDVSDYPTYTLGAGTVLAASGTGTVVGTSAAAIKGGAGGTVSLGSRTITLTYDGSNPALYVSQGTLSLGGNAITVNRASPLSNGIYPLIRQATGNMVSSGTFTVAGTAIDTALHSAYIAVSGGNVNLVIIPPTPAKLVISAVNGGANPSAGAGYDVTVTVQDMGGIVRNVAANTGVTLSLASGTAGSLGGTLTGTIPNGSSSVTFNGVTNRVAEAVTLQAAASSGTSLTAGSVSYAIVPAAAADLTVTGFPSPQDAGISGSVTVTAYDAYGNVATHYAGTVRFTSNDGSASLPENHTFTGVDAGTHMFSNEVTFHTSGTRFITATDTATGTITGTQAGIVVSPTPIRAWTTAGTTTWTVPAGVTAVELLVVGGGGGGGANGVCGGGGAGGLIYYGTESPAVASSYAVVPGQNYSVTVGSGGNAHTSGGDSSFGPDVIAVGGGYGGQRWGEAGGVGGSGGGASVGGWSPIASGAAGTPGQGHAGGGSSVTNGQNQAVGGGGGGAGTAGSNGVAGVAGNGGDGLSYTISGAAVAYAGGGGGSQMEAGVDGLGGAGYLNPGGGGMANGLNSFAGQAGIVIVRYVEAAREPFASWIDGFAAVPTGQNGFGDDPNHDGVANGFAWILSGGTPLGDSHAALPAVTHHAGRVILEFICLKPGELGTAILAVQYSRDLGTGDPWHSANVPGASGTVNKVVFTVTGHDATHNHVQAEIPQSAAPGGKLYGRLSATIP